MINIRLRRIVCGSPASSYSSVNGDLNKRFNLGARDLNPIGFNWLILTHPSSNPLSIRKTFYLCYKAFNVIIVKIN